MINESFETLKFISENRKIKTTLTVDPNEVKLFKNVYGDRNRYQQFLLNFISNSLKFTSSGGKVNIILKKKETKFK